MTEIPAHYEAPPMAECLKTLSASVPPELIRQRQRGGADLSYLEWFTVNRLLDARAPGWCGEVRSVTTTGDTVIVSYRISIPTAEGWIHREAVGSDNLRSGFDPIASAEQQSFKRAAARFGLGLELYNRDSKPAPRRQRSHQEISREEWLARRSPVTQRS